MTPPAPTPLSRLHAALMEGYTFWFSDFAGGVVLRNASEQMADQYIEFIVPALSRAGLVLADAAPPPGDAPDMRCGTCLHFSGADRPGHNHLCIWAALSTVPVPLWATVTGNCVVQSTHGHDCPAWEARDDG